MKLASKDEIIRKMRIQLNLFLVRQAKHGHKNDAQIAEEMENMKKKYIRVLKLYHSATQELKAFNRKNQHMDSTFEGSRRSLSGSIDSLSLSP